MTREPPIPAIVRIGTTVYGGTLERDALAVQGFAFQYLSRAGKVRRWTGKFTLLATFNIAGGINDYTRDTLVTGR